MQLAGSTQGGLWRLMMNANEGKIDPELQRWVKEGNGGQRTVVVRFGYSQEPDEAVEALSGAGMSVQSSGPGVIVAASDRKSVLRVSKIPWVIKIGLPRQLDMKSRLRGS